MPSKKQQAVPPFPAPLFRNSNPPVDLCKATLEAASVVVRVGDGRGFVIESAMQGQLVVTAAHCLPHLPPAHAASHIEERTYQNLLGRLGRSTDVWAECLFVDPVADIALLGSPDCQELNDQATAYDDLVDGIALPVHSPQNGEGWMMRLDGRWVRATVKVEHYRTLEINATEGGQSGSPILNRRLAAIGVIVAGVEIGGQKDLRAGLQPALAHALPRWVLHQPKRRKNGGVA